MSTGNGARTEETAVPTGWELVELGEVVEFTQKPRGLKPEGAIPFVPMKLISEQGSAISEFEERRKASSGTYFEEGDLLVARITPCFENGKQGIVHSVPGGWGIATTEVYALSSEAVSRKFLAYFFRWHEVHGELLRRMEGATGRMRVPKEAVEELRLPVPPRAEQERIIEAVESAMELIDEAEESLRQAEVRLAQLRLSVLAAAVTGALPTAESEVGGADQLLRKILKERAEPAGHGAKAPAEPSPVEGVELPSGWTWATVDQLSTMVQYGSSSKTNEDASGVPVLRMGNLVDGEISLDKLKYLPADHSEFPELLLKDGDLLFNRTNSPELVGKAALYRGQVAPCSFASYLIRVRLSRHFRPELLNYLLGSALGRRWVSSVVSQQVGQANVNGTKLKQLTVPLPPREVQGDVCEIAERQLDQVNVMRQGIASACVSAAAMRRSILYRAFTGQLVLQDPNDEPASGLLERNKVEKAEREAELKAAKKRARAGQTRGEPESRARVRSGSQTPAKATK